MLKDASKKIRFVNQFLRKDFLHVNMQLLYNCNFKCRICDFWKEPYLDYPKLSKEQVEIISSKLKSIGSLMVSIGGGEPLLHPDLIDITGIIAKDHFPMMICNGWYISPKNARELFKAGMYEVSISVDYADAARHDEQRGHKGAYNKAISALQILHENRVYPNQRVHMISVVMDDNLDQIEPLIKIAKKMGITYLVTFYSNGRGTKEQKKFSADISKYLLSLKKQYKEFVVFPGYINKFTEAYRNNGGIQPCYAGKNLFNIDSQGNVSRCIDRLDEYAGNIFTDDIHTIRQKLLYHFKETKCGECWTSCRGTIESLMYGGKHQIQNLRAFRNITKDVPLVSSN
jgi:radical SAM protein with 4Fe4S-binding SPASM domain